ncbi:MAG TPA: septum formation initiator family protein [Candidatus Cybelea sp.]|nr:septum formation initiator family protein [Candidatus Cybelea sp.]
MRSILAAVGLYAGAALLIGYFGVNAYTGARGLRAHQDLAQQMSALTAEVAALKLERQRWEHRVSLLRSDAIDPDLLDERVRVMLDYVDPHDLILMRKR